MKAKSPIITNSALRAMKRHRLSEAQVLDAFNHGEVERSNLRGRWTAVRKYQGYEIGVNFDQRADGRYVIISVWKRQRR